MAGFELVLGSRRCGEVLEATEVLGWGRSTVAVGRQTRLEGWARSGRRRDTVVRIGIGIGLHVIWNLTMGKKFLDLFCGH